MIQLKKTFLTLALLITAVGGAWAQSTFNVMEFEVPAAWANDNSNVTAGDLTGFSASSLAEAQAWTGAPAPGNSILIYAFDGDNVCFVQFINEDPSEGRKSPWSKSFLFSIKSDIKFFITTELTEWPLTSQDGKNWTLAKMPANDIELEVEYYDPILTLAANNSEWGKFEVTYAGEIDGSKLTLIEATKGLYGDIPENLFDGKTDTKWCCETSNGCYIEFYTENAIEVVGYILTTANDNEGWPGRNPKNWVLKGKLNENGEWETIATVSNDTKMKDVNFTPYQFDADKPGSYKYFRFEIKETTGDNVLQLSEFTLLKKSSLPDITFNEGKYSIIPGAEVTIKAIPAEGYHFDAWSNNEEGYEVGKLRLIIDEDKEITAIFAENEYNITFKAANDNTIEAGKATVKVGDAAAQVDEKGNLTGVKKDSKVTVTAKEGYKFRKAEVKKHDVKD